MIRSKRANARQHCGLRWTWRVKIRTFHNHCGLHQCLARFRLPQERSDTHVICRIKIDEVGWCMKGGFQYQRIVCTELWSMRSLHIWPELCWISPRLSWHQSLANLHGGIACSSHNENKNAIVTRTQYCDVGHCVRASIVASEAVQGWARRLWPNLLRLN